MSVFNFTSNVSGTANVWSGESTAAIYQNSPIDELRKLLTQGGNITSGYVALTYVTSGTLATISGQVVNSGYLNTNYVTSGFVFGNYLLSGSALLSGSLQFPTTFGIYITSGTYNTQNANGQVIIQTKQTSGAEVHFQASVSGATSGGLFYVDRGVYTFQGTCFIPTGGNVYVFQGVPAKSRQAGTSFTVGTSFPDQTYCFSVSGGPGSNVDATLHMDGMYFYNPNFKTPGSIDAGGIYFEVDAINNEQIRIENCQFQYMWRGIYIAGPVYYGTFRNLWFGDFNTNFVGDVDIMMNGFAGHTVDQPKLCYFENIKVNRAAGHEVMNASLYMRGGYNYVHRYTIDGPAYRSGAFILSQAFGNRMDGLCYIDSISGAAPGAIVFDNDSLISGLFTTYGNILTNVEVGKAGNQSGMIAFRSSAFSNYVQASFFGSEVSVDDTGAGPKNVVVIYPGEQATNTLTPWTALQAKAKTVSGLVTLEDHRPGSTVQGSATISSGVTSLVVSNASFDVVSKVQITPTTAPVSGMIYWVSGKASGAFTVFLTPSAFSGGFSFDYTASVYP